MASILKSNVKGIPALFGLDPVSNFLGLTVNHMTVFVGRGTWGRLDPSAQAGSGSA